VEELIQKHCKRREKIYMMSEELKRLMDEQRKRDEELKRWREELERLMGEQCKRDEELERWVEEKCKRGEELKRWGEELVNIPFWLPPESYTAISSGTMNGMGNDRSVADQSLEVQLSQNGMPSLQQMSRTDFAADGVVYEFDSNLNQAEKIASGVLFDWEEMDD
jgi:hypothetical protein